MNGIVVVLVEIGIGIGIRVGMETCETIQSNLASGRYFLYIHISNSWPEVFGNKNSFSLRRV